MYVYASEVRRNCHSTGAKRKKRRGERSKSEETRREEKRGKEKRTSVQIARQAKPVGIESAQSERPARGSQTRRLFFAGVGRVRNGCGTGAERVRNGCGTGAKRARSRPNHQPLAQTRARFAT